MVFLEKHNHKSELVSMHSDFSHYIVVEEGDPRSKMLLDHVSNVFASFSVLLNSKFGFAEHNISMRPIAFNSLISSLKRLPKFRNEEEIKVFALAELKLCSQFIKEEVDAASMPLFCSEKVMIEKTAEEISKNLGKEISYEDALRIYTFLKVEANDLGKIAEPKKYLASNITKTRKS
ncbi:MAG: hypothetical protein ACP5SJ_00660 [Candidatus Micrarchaeia archaeon]